MLLTQNSALLVVDMQYDFLPGGKLAVEEGDQIIPGINQCISEFFHAGALVVLTQDWHPRGHASFASSHDGKNPHDPIEDIEGIGPVLWPDHCVQGTVGAAFHDDLNTSMAYLVLRKGFNKNIDSYSAFLENDLNTKTGLEGYLKEKSIKTLYLCGLAFDYCVYYTAIDGMKLGFDVIVFSDLTRSVNSPEGRVDKVKADLESKGCKLFKFLK